MTVKPCGYFNFFICILHSMVSLKNAGKWKIPKIGVCPKSAPHAIGGGVWCCSNSPRENVIRMQLEGLPVEGCAMNYTQGSNS